MVTGLAAPPVNAPPPAVATLTAATVTALAAALWPKVLPAVAMAGASRARFVSSRMARATPEYLTTYSREPTGNEPDANSKGSCVPLWTLALEPMIVVPAAFVTIRS